MKQRQRPKNAEESLEIVRMLSEHDISRSPYAVLIHFVERKKKLVPVAQPIQQFEGPRRDRRSFERIGNPELSSHFQPLRGVAVCSDDEDEGESYSASL